MQFEFLSVAFGLPPNPKFDFSLHFFLPSDPYQLNNLQAVAQNLQPDTKYKDLNAAVKKLFEDLGNYIFEQSQLSDQDVPNRDVNKQSIEIADNLQKVTKWDFFSSFFFFFN